MIEARNVSVWLGGARILHDVDFEARPGKVTAIVGPNGSGKTTFLRALSGDLPAAGTILLNGRDLRELKPWQAASNRADARPATHCCHALKSCRSVSSRMSRTRNAC